MTAAPAPRRSQEQPASPALGVGAVLSAVPAEPTRREAGAGPRLGERGQRTRAALLAAARDVFTVNGYHGTSVAMIAERAGVSLGTFYTYFADRSGMLAQLVEDAVRSLLADPDRVWRVAQGREGIYRVLLSYVRAHSEDAGFWGVWEEVTLTDVPLAALRRDLSRLLIATVSRELARGIEAGLVRPDVDPDGTARALTSMVDRYCHVTYSFDPPDPPPSAEQSAHVLTEVWARTVLIDPGSAPAPRRPESKRKPAGR